MLTFGIINFAKNNFQRVFSLILILLGTQFSIEFIEIIQKSFFRDDSSIITSFTVVDMALNQIQFHHLLILIAGTSSLIFGNMFYWRYFFSSKNMQDLNQKNNKKSYVSSNFFYFLLLLPIFFICLFLLYQFVLSRGGLSSIFINIGAYRSGEYSGTGSGFFLYPSLIAFPAFTTYFLIHNKFYPTDMSKIFKYSSLLFMFTLLLAATIVSGFRLHLLIWIFVLFAAGLIGSNINIKVLIFICFLVFFIIMLGITRSFLESGVDIDAINIIDILMTQLNRVPSLSYISLTEIHIIPRFEYLLQFIFEPFLIFLFPSLWASPLGDSYAYDVAYEFLYLRGGYVTNLGGISVNPILFFYWMLGVIFMPILLFIFGILVGLCDNFMSGLTKSRHLLATFISIFLLLSIESPAGAVNYIIYVGIVWMSIIGIERLFLNAIKNIK